MLSLVRAKRVPIEMALAPSAKAAASPLPSPYPPADMMGILKAKITGMKAITLDFGVKDVIKYVEPKIVIEVKCMAKTEDGSLRFPAFLRVRTDKEPSECKINQ